MGRLLLINLEGYFYSCNHCDTPLALVNHLLSTKFECPYKGRAYLFDKVVNVLDGEREDPVPGSHSTIVKIFCGRCEYFLGWKFVRLAVLENQRFKFLLLRCLLTPSFLDIKKESLSLQGLKILVPNEDPNIAALEEV